MDSTYDRTIRVNAIKRLCDRGAGHVAKSLLGQTRVRARGEADDLIVWIFATWQDADVLRRQTMTHTGSEMPGPLDDALAVTLRRWPTEVRFVVIPAVDRAA